MVYNGTSCGLNSSLWAPNFWLPNANSALRLLDHHYYSVDLDLGEMFLNFPAHPSFARVSGVNLTFFRNEPALLKTAPEVGSVKKQDRVLFQWNRMWMGSKPCPYWAVRFYYLAEEFCRGRPEDPNSPMKWDHVHLNMPGDAAYDPRLVRVHKIDAVHDRVTGDVIVFVDDVRTTGQTAELAWAVARRIGSRAQYLGTQDASRKRRPPSKSPGAWAGRVFSTANGVISKSVAPAKWRRAKEIIEKWRDRLRGDPSADLGYKELERDREFLVHMAMTFEDIHPYLKGFHLTLASHLSQRDKDGWKLANHLWKEFAMMNGHDEESCQPMDLGDHPDSIKAVPLLIRHLEALAAFFTADAPPRIPVRSLVVYLAIYGFGDASGKGFGSSFAYGDQIQYRIGTWGTTSGLESSNWKELGNSLSAIRHEAEAGRLEGCELVFCTDNSTVESFCANGTSSSRKLHELIVELKSLPYTFGFRLMVIHVSEKRMIAQGTDGISRGELREGVRRGNQC
jgi:hypothetical protein